MRYLFLVALFAVIGCNSQDDCDNCGIENSYYRDEMRNFVIGLSTYSKSKTDYFVVVPQNGIELSTLGDDANGTPATDYLNAIDGNAQEDIFFGYDNDDVATPANTSAYLTSYLNVSKNAGNTVFTIDYCSSPNNISTAYEKSRSEDFVPFVATDRNLRVVPDVDQDLLNVQTADVTKLKQANNLLYLLNYEQFNTKQEVMEVLTNTDADVIVMDMYYDDTKFTQDEIALLKYKANGGKRLVMSYMSIGEAEDYRYYWQASWANETPEWLHSENENWPGNYKVKYWNTDWQALIYGNSAAYLDQIIDAGFDGVYLDIVDAFDYFEDIEN